MGSGASGPRAVVVVVVAVVVVAHLPLFSKVTLEDAFSVEVEVEFPVVDAKTPRRRRFPGSLSNGAEEEEEEEVAAAPTAVMVGPLGDTAVVRLKEVTMKGIDVNASSSLRGRRRCCREKRGLHLLVRKKAEGTMQVIVSRDPGVES